MARTFLDFILTSTGRELEEKKQILRSDVIANNIKSSIPIYFLLRKYFNFFVVKKFPKA